MTIGVGVILTRKGSTVATIGVEATLADAVQALADHNIGALVVSPDGVSVEGVLSERDIVRRLARHGPDALSARVADAMSAPAITCGPHTTVDELMAIMTQRRIRHIPVVADDRLAGIVSIGDIVKSRIDELEMQTQSLQDYVTGSY